MTVLGLDISDQQGDLTDAHWVTISATHRFVYAQAREGNKGNSQRFPAYVAGARAAGVACGAYLFAYLLPDDGVHPGRDPESQVQAFFEASGGLGGATGELPPALDLEDPPPERWAADGVTAAFAEDWSGRAIDRVVALWGVLPVVYTYDWWAIEAKLVRAGACPLWLAHYSGATYKTAPPWPAPTILQQGNGVGPGALILPNGRAADEDEAGDDDFAALLVRP